MQARCGPESEARSVRKAAQAGWDRPFAGEAPLPFVGSQGEAVLERGARPGGRPL